jgi:hypothetical protein
MAPGPAFAGPFLYTFHLSFCPPWPVLSIAVAVPSVACCINKLTMQKNSISLLAITGAMLLIQSCSNSKETTSVADKKQPSYFSRTLSPHIDGKMNDWGDTLVFFDNNTKCIYSIANDSANLYIYIKATDRQQQMKMIQGGTEVWIDTKAKKNKSAGIIYPIGGGTMQMPGSKNSQSDEKQMRQQLRSQMLTLELTGFKAAINGQHSVYSDMVVKAAIDWDTKENLIYELAIPLNTLLENPSGQLQNISIGMVIKGMKMPEGMAGGNMPGGGMPSGGMRPPAGMRPPGGGSMPDMSQIQSITKENSFWTNYSIAL